jgi:ubiquitin carboxyl-terminal hydrolase 36/42
MNLQVSQPVYNLFGSIVHSGFSPDSGHYYAYVKVLKYSFTSLFTSIPLFYFLLDNNWNLQHLQDAIGRWYCCNDSHVSLSSSQNVLSEKVYILFYILSSKTQKPSTNGYSSAAVKSFSTNGNGITSATSSESLKVPFVKQDGSCSAENNAVLPMKNGNTASGQHIKPIHLNNNSKAHLTSRSNLGINGSATPSEANGCKAGKLAEPSNKSGNGRTREKMDENSESNKSGNGRTCEKMDENSESNKSGNGRTCEKMDENSERIQQDANGNGHTTLFQCSQQISEQPLGPVASKSSVLHQEDLANSVKDVVKSTKNSVSLKHQREEENLKEM